MEAASIDLESQAPNAPERLAQFDVFRTAYKHINSQPILAFILIPKTLPAGVRPLLVRFHGGALTEGIAEGFLRPWILDLALKHGAVLVTPDYRLRPEHEMREAVEDIRDFWKWIDGALPGVLAGPQSPRRVDLDPTNVAITGESGGGYLTIQTALLGLTAHPIRALIPAYGVLDLPAHNRRVVAKPGWAAPLAVLEEHLAQVEPGQIMTRAPYGSRMHIFKSMAANGRLVDLDGEDAWLDPMTALDDAPAMPPTLIFHGTEDETPVRHEDAAVFVEKLRRLQPDTPLRFELQPGPHTFDQEHTLETGWLKEPIAFVEKYWPA